MKQYDQKSIEEKPSGKPGVNGYDHIAVEEKWLKVWEAEEMFQGTVEEMMERGAVSNAASPGHLPGKEREEGEILNQVQDDSNKMYLLFAFAYPSGEGLHVGHVESKTALDILARYYRMQGKQVFFPVGWDAFGLPAENYAIKTGVPPVLTTKKAIDNFRRQIKRLGISYDWETEIATSHPEYYKWTQWLFLQLYDKGLAYKAPGKVNWCPSCQTVLANEQVVQKATSDKLQATSEMVGVCERCETPVVQKELEQWYLKITDYKEELISGLEQVDWPVATKQQQLNWIGRREGVNVTFGIELKEVRRQSRSSRASGTSAVEANTVADRQDDTSELEGGSDMSIDREWKVTTFTTRIDTIFGVTFLVISPELAKAWMARGWQAGQEVEDYVARAFGKTEEERKVGEKEKTGVDTGLKAINPVNGEKVPVYVADYVLFEYGTGAVMGVPAHDLRDLAFAKKYGLPVRQVIAKEGGIVRSILRGVEKIEDGELEELGVEIVVERDGEWELEIPRERLGRYEVWVREKLKPGHWVEWVGEKIEFAFKDTSGQVRKLELSRETEQAIDMLVQENGGRIEGASVWEWLARKQFYTELIIHAEYGVMVNSGQFDGMRSEEAMEVLPEKFAGLMERTTKYKLRDWLISRQRYWGTPIPIVYDLEGKEHPVRDEHLPWLLPTDVTFQPTGESPLKDSVELKQRVEKIYGKGWTPEYDTMDTFVDSSWYYLRYPSVRWNGWEHGREVLNRDLSLEQVQGEPAEDKIADQESMAGAAVTDDGAGTPFDVERTRKWMPVDLYMIGPEHIVLHLLYSRFFTKFLRDEGYLCEAQSPKSKTQKENIGPNDHEKHREMGLFCISEPFLKMRHQGMILGPDHKKMSKSRGNVISPDEIVEKYGADTLRMYEMFMGPLEADKPWDPRAVMGVYRFLTRVYRLVRDNSKSEIQNPKQAANSNDQNVKQSDELRRLLHQTVKKVGEDIPALKFNTAIAAMMEFVNSWEQLSREKRDGYGMTQKDIGMLVRVLAPLAPFMAEELWSKLQVTSDKGKEGSGCQHNLESDANIGDKDSLNEGKAEYSKQKSVHCQIWPVSDEALVSQRPVTIVIQVNGKRRADMEIESNEVEGAESQEKIYEQAKKLDGVRRWLEGKEVKKTFWVPPRDGSQGLINFVVEQIS